MITPLWHLSAAGLEQDEFRRVQEICRRHGGRYLSGMASLGTRLPPGYLFRSADDAKAAEAEIERTKDA